MPGTPLGTFKISASVVSNSCGAAMALPEIWSFEVELSRVGDLLVWRQNDKLVSGPIDADGTAKVETAVTNLVVAPADGLVGCSMTREDTVTVALPADADVKTVTGTISFSVSMVTGSDCTSQLAAQGGAYDAIPCTTELTYTATRTAAP